MINVYDVMIKTDKEKNIWETKKMFEYDTEGTSESLKYAKSLEEEGYEVSVGITKIETAEDIVQRLTDLFYSSKRLSHLIGEDVLLNAFKKLND